MTIDGVERVMGSGTPFCATMAGPLLNRAILAETRFLCHTIVCTNRAVVQVSEILPNTAKTPSPGFQHLSLNPSTPLERNRFFPS